MTRGDRRGTLAPLDSGLADLVVWITGASGGIGRALAEAFAAEGCRLALHAGSRRDELEQWLAGRRWRPRALCGACDVRDEGALDAETRRIVAHHGRIDVAVISAGIWPSEDAALHAQAPERIRAVVETNLLGAIWSARALLARLAETGPRDDGRGASLLFIGSTAGRFGEAGHAEYAASKAALRGLSLSLKNEIVRLDPGARCNLVEPGWTLGPMAGPALERAAPVERALSTMPLRQLARAEDVAAAAVFLSSPLLARHLSGAVLTVAGGMEGRRLWGDGEIDVTRVRRDAQSR
jgi:3-oxoacyl-[acyl-carrier protein] reductase